MPDLFAGDKPIYSRRVGTKEVLKVLLGEQLIWPPEQQVQVVSVNVGTSTVPTIGPHDYGDMLVVVAVAAGSTPPSLPTDWTSAYVSDGLSPLAFRIGFRFAYQPNYTGGLWAGATWVAGYVFRGTDFINPLGVIDSLFTASVETGNAPGITPSNRTGASAVVNNFINNGTATSLLTDGPVGWQPRNRNARVAVGRRIDSRVVLPSTDAFSTSLKADWRGITFEVPPASGLQHLGTYSTNGEMGTRIAPHQPGDLIVVVAQKQNTTVQFSPATPPAVVGQTYPVWTNAYDSNVSSVQGANMATKITWGIATTSSHDTGVFTGATWTTVMVFRNANQSNPIGDIAGVLYTAQPPGPVPSPALNMQDKSGRSLHIVTMHESNTSATSYFPANPPDGWVRLMRSGHRLFSASLDRKTGPVCTETAVQTTAQSWRAVAFEVKAA